MRLLNKSSLPTVLLQRSAISRVQLIDDFAASFKPRVLLKGLWEPI